MALPIPLEWITVLQSRQGYPRSPTRLVENVSLLIVPLLKESLWSANETKRSVRWQRRNAVRDASLCWPCDPGVTAANISNPTAVVIQSEGPSIRNSHRIWPKTVSRKDTKCHRCQSRFMHAPLSGFTIGLGISNFTHMDACL